MSHLPPDQPPLLVAVPDPPPPVPDRQLQVLDFQAAPYRRAAELLEQTLRRPNPAPAARGS